MNPRKLVAIDIVFLGAKLIMAEYALGVVVSIALGVITLRRNASGWQLFLGVYLILMGINYVPLLIHAVGLAGAGSARAEVGEELNNKRAAMSKYRRQSLWILVPLFVAITALRQRGWNSSRL